MGAHQKKLYKCCFNYGHEIITEHEWAFSGLQAKNYAIRKIARKHDVNPYHVFAIFDGSKPNFNIEVDKEWKKKLGRQ